MRTPTLRRLSPLPLIAATVTLLAACGSPSTPAPEGGGSIVTTTAAPTTEPGTPPPTTAPTDDPLLFTVDGTGPYQLGTTFTQLQSANLLDEVTTGGEVCSQNTYARGTDLYTDVRLGFRPDGVLYLVSNRSPALHTPSGAVLGNTLAELNTIYASATHEDLSVGMFQSFLVTAGSGRGILFDLGNTGKVFAMHAADATFLKFSVQNGTDFC